MAQPLNSFLCTAQPPRHRHLLPHSSRLRSAQRILLLQHALDSDRRLARHRIRYSRRPLRPPARDGAGILRPQSHRRLDVARHQRPQQRPHGHRSGHHVYRPDSRDDGARSFCSRAAFGHAHALDLAAGAHRLLLRSPLRQSHPRSLRKNSGVAGFALRESPGKSIGRSRRPRLRAGRSGSPRLRRTESRIRRAQHQADSHLEPLHAVATGADRHVVFDRALEGRRSAPDRADYARRVDRFLHVPGFVGLADDRAWMGHEHLSARRGQHGAAQLHFARRSRKSTIAARRFRNKRKWRARSSFATSLSRIRPISRATAQARKRQPAALHLCLQNCSAAHTATTAQPPPFFTTSI